MYRASYTGQLKAFFDLLPRAALAGCAVGLIATGGVPRPCAGHRSRPAAPGGQPRGPSAAHAVYATDADLETFPNGPLPDAVDAATRRRWPTN